MHAALRGRAPGRRVTQGGGCRAPGLLRSHRGQDRGDVSDDIVFLGIVVIGAIAFIFDLMMRQLEKKLVPWKGKA